jgi:hypothetical protein
MTDITWLVNWLEESKTIFLQKTPNICTGQGGGVPIRYTPGTNVVAGDCFLGQLSMGGILPCGGG